MNRVLSAALLALCAASQAAGMRAVQLRCEYLDNPLGIDVARPRLSWVLEADERGQRQSAYQIVVASSAARLESDQGDLWDSGEVTSDEQNQIEYAGRPLASNQACVWKVRVWDGEGRPGSWSATARWTMGIVAAQDWKAKWIGAAKGADSPLGQCSWVWFPENDPASAAPPGKRLFRKRFQLSGDARVERASMFLSADNSFRLFANGVETGSGGTWEIVQSLDLTPRLRAGDNIIAIAAENGGSGPNPAGLIGKLVVRLAGGAEVTVPIDGSWRASDREPAGWERAEFDDASWPLARVLGPFGMEPWKRTAAWQESLPLFRKSFEISKPVRRAIVHVCGLGHYELSLDGKKVGDRFLDPAWSVYEKTASYATYDISAELGRGPHAFGVMLGKGFYNTAGDRRVHGVNADRPLKLILQAHVAYEDGSEDAIASDGSWRSAPGPITHSAILGGEDHDARKLPAGWDRPGFDDAAWSAALETEGPGGALSASFAPPLTYHDVFKPVRIDEPEPGIFVYDFGQNASAVPRLRVRGKAGDTLKLTPAEQRHGMTPRRNDGRGLVNPAGVGTPSYFRYTLRGGGEAEAWTPQFSYTGFQYLQLEGAVPSGRPNPRGLPVVEDLVSVHVRNGAPSVGRFACSEPLFEKTDRVIDWAVRSNLSHVLTDCPHREKLGWLEVAYLMGPSIAGRYDIAGFYGKVARDCADSQGRDGMVPTVAPAYPAFGGGFAYTPEWGAAAVVVPWLVYEWYGDRAVLAARFENMRRFVDYLRAASKDFVPRPGLGDWYDYGHGKPVGASQFTPVELSAMATFYRCADIVARAAGVLGRADDERRHGDLAAAIARAFNARWFDGDAEYRNNGSPQTANSMALALGIVPADRAQAVLERVVQDIRRRGGQQTAGDIGYWYLLHALAENGRSDVIHALASRTAMGSYGFIVNNGWTSMPEAWDADTGASMNHCMLGHIQEWFLGWVAGIRPDPAAPGFKRFTVAPQPVGDLVWATGTYDSIRGRIVSAWRKEKDRFTLKLTVPTNSTAKVILHARDARSITEGGRDIAGAAGVELPRAAAGVKLVSFAAGRAILEVGGGSYEFECEFPGADE